MRALYVLSLPLALTACGDYVSTAANAPSGAPVNVGYLCDDGQRPIVRWFGTERASVRLDDGRTLDVLPDPAGSTTRYSAGGLTINYAPSEIRMSSEGKEVRCEKLGQGPTTPG